MGGSVGNFGVVTVFVGNIVNLDVSALLVNIFEGSLDNHFVFVVEHTFLEGFDVVGEFEDVFEAIMANFVEFIEDFHVIMMMVVVVIAMVFF